MTAPAYDPDDPLARALADALGPADVVPPTRRTDWTAEEIAELVAIDGHQVTTRHTRPVHGPDGELIGVETVTEPGGTFVVPWGEGGFPPHPDDAA